MGLNPNGNILIFSPTMNLPGNPYQYVDSLLLRIIHQIQGLKMGLAYFPTYQEFWWPAWNKAWNLAFQHNFEYILRIDDDIHNIPDDAIKKLVEANKDVIGAAYPKRIWPHFTCALNRTKNISLIEIGMSRNPDDYCLQYVTENDENREGEPANAIVPCELIGMGMTLIKTEKFRQLSRPIFLGNEQDVLDDTYFAQLCLDNKIKQYVHFGVRVEHDYVNYSNNGFLFNAGLMQRQRDEQEQLEEMKKKGLIDENGNPIESEMKVESVTPAPEIAPT